MLKDISITNLFDKSNGKYKDLPLYNALLNFDIIYLSETIEEIISYYNENLERKRIDLRFGSEILSRYNLPFDSFAITLYRDGEELNNKDYTSNYIYNEFEGMRDFWVDLYYSKEEYDSEDIVRDIMNEIVNFIYRDFNEYFKYQI